MRLYRITELDAWQADRSAKRDAARSARVARLRAQLERLEGEG
jgi:hypothetical protein